MRLDGLRPCIEPHQIGQARPDPITISLSLSPLHGRELWSSSTCQHHHGGSSPNQASPYITDLYISYGLTLSRWTEAHGLHGRASSFSITTARRRLSFKPLGLSQTTFFIPLRSLSSISKPNRGGSPKDKKKSQKVTVIVCVHTHTYIYIYMSNTWESRKLRNYLISCFCYLIPRVLVLLFLFFTQIYSHVHLLSYLAEKLEINIKSEFFIFLKPKPNIFIHSEKKSPNTNPQGMEVETPPSTKYPHLWT